jgi:hypothetical protein
LRHFSTTTSEGLLSSKIKYQNIIYIIFPKLKIRKPTLCQLLKLRWRMMLGKKTILSLSVLGLLELPLQCLFKGYIIGQTVNNTQGCAGLIAFINYLGFLNHFHLVLSFDGVSWPSNTIWWCLMIIDLRIFYRVGVCSSVLEQTESLWTGGTSLTPFKNGWRRRV